MKRLLLLPALSLMALINGFACSCMPAGYFFCETLANDNSIDAVVMVRKTADYHYGMKVELLTHFDGNAVPDTFTVWGDNGALCRLYTSWNIGDTIILALQKCDLAGNTIINSEFPPDLENPDDYQVSVCGVYSLNVENGMVTGYIDAAQMQLMPLQQFTSLACIHTLGGGPIEQEEELLLFPNPAVDQIVLYLQNSGIRDLTVVNAEGRIVFRKTGYVLNTPVDLHSFRPGLYHLIITNEDRSTVRRFVRLEQ